MSLDVYTIGVYNKTEQEFFNLLINNKVDLFCDIRQRRGVRGAKYSFVNSNKLQSKLEELGINYIYISGLAPTKEIRELQKNADYENKELKSKRTKLGEVFVREFTNTVLMGFDFEKFFESIKQFKGKKIVLFCVEENAEACHRSLVSSILQNNYKLKVKNL